MKQFENNKGPVFIELKMLYMQKYNDKVKRLYIHTSQRNNKNTYTYKIVHDSLSFLLHAYLEDGVNKESMVLRTYGIDIYDPIGNFQDIFLMNH